MTIFFANGILASVSVFFLNLLKVVSLCHSSFGRDKVFFKGLGGRGTPPKEPLEAGYIVVPKENTYHWPNCMQAQHWNFPSRDTSAEKLLWIGIL